jgi:hypothetical protein
VDLLEPHLLDELVIPKDPKGFFVELDDFAAELQLVI